MSATHLVVIEAGLAGNSYGATISWSDPMTESDALTFAAEAAAGRKPEIVTVGESDLLVRVAPVQFLVIEDRRAARLTRISVAEIVRT